MTKKIKFYDKNTIGIDTGANLGVAIYLAKESKFKLLHPDFHGLTTNLMFDFFCLLIDKFSVKKGKDIILPDVIYENVDNVQISHEASYSYGTIRNVLRSVCKEKGVKLTPLAIKIIRKVLCGSGDCNKADCHVMIDAFLPFFTEYAVIQITSDEKDALAVLLAYYFKGKV